MLLMRWQGAACFEETDLESAGNIRVYEGLQEVILCGAYMRGG